MTNENETVEQVYDTIEERLDKLWGLGYSVMGNGEVVSFAKQFLAAHKCELADKDAEIAKRNALIKELAGALKWCHEQADAIGKATLIGCFQMDALAITMANMSRRCIKLVKKAREATNG